MEEPAQKCYASSFIPYRRAPEGHFEVFLQKRTADSPTFPGFVGFFGGARELGEDAFQAMMREVLEELGYVPKDPIHVTAHDDGFMVKDVFVEEVGESFERDVVVMEGEYGRFYSEAQIVEIEKMQPKNRQILKEVFLFLRRLHLPADAPQQIKDLL